MTWMRKYRDQAPTSFDSNFTDYYFRLLLRWSDSLHRRVLKKKIKNNKKNHSHIILCSFICMLYQISCVFLASYLQALLQNGRYHLQRISNEPSLFSVREQKNKTGKDYQRNQESNSKMEKPNHK